MKQILKLLCLTIFCNLITSFAYAGILTTSLNRNDIAMGQTFNLIINAESDESDLNPPDLSPLYANFTVLGTARSQSLTIVNNKIAREDQWVITLTPKHAGKLLIPNISIGKDKTKAFSINVAASQTVKKNGGKGIFLDVKLTPERPYVNSEMIYQLKIFYDVNVGAASIAAPHSNDAVIKQLGQDRSYVVKIKGKNFQVFQRNFAIFPQKAGKIALKPAIFRGQIADKSSNIAYSGFDSLNTKPIQLIGPAVTIDVKAVPENINNEWWLPSGKVSLTEHWSNNQNQVETGSPITRTITLSAAGLMASQLPPLTTGNGKDYNSYGSQAKPENIIINGQLVGNKTVKFVYIPTHKGEILLPSVSVKWWNVKTHTLETATLPVKSFKVVDGMANSAEETAAPPNPTPETLTANKINAPKPRNDWIYISIGFLILWLGTVFAWRFSKHDKKSINSVNTKTKKIKPTFQVSLKEACLNNTPQEVKAALLVWAREKFNSNSIQTLNDVSQQIDDETFVEQIKLLQQKLYRQTAMVWTGEKLWQCVKSFKLRKIKHSKNDHSLPKLNPE